MATKSPGAIKAGQAFVEIFADDSKLVSGLRSAERRVKAWGASVSAVGRSLALAGSMMTAPLVASVKVMTGMGDQMATLSARTRMTSEFLSTLAFAAGQTNVAQEALADGLQRLNLGMALAGRGGKRMIDNFSRLGLSYKTLSALSPEDRFLAVADAISKIPDAAEKAYLSTKLLGPGLAPLIDLGRAGIKALQATGKARGLEISSADVKRADAFGDSLASIWSQIKTVAFSVGVDLLPALEDLATWLTRNLKIAIDFVKSNAGLIISYAKLSVAVLGAGVGLMVLGKALQLAAIPITLLRVGCAVLTGVFTTLGAVFAFAVTPIGVLTIALAALAAAVAWRAGGIAKSAAVIGGAFNSAKADAVDMMAGIKDALSSGDIGLAASLLWTTIQLEFQRGILVVKELWNGLWRFLHDNPLAKALDNAIMGMQLIFNDIVVGFNLAMIDMAAGFVKAREYLLGRLTPERAKKIDDAEAAQKKRWTDAGAQYEADLLAAEQNRQAVSEMTDKQSLASTQKKIDALKDQLDFEKRHAAFLKEYAAYKSRTADTDKPGPGPELKIVIPDIAEAIRATVVGTFSGAALSLMGYQSGDADKRTAAATEGIEDDTALLVKSNQKIADTLASALAFE